MSDRVKDLEKRVAELHELAETYDARRREAMRAVEAWRERCWVAEGRVEKKGGGWCPSCRAPLDVVKPTLPGRRSCECLYCGVVFDLCFHFAEQPPISKSKTDE